MLPSRPTPHYCSDDQLAYQRSRQRLDKGRPLAFDDSYRLAHLPLVAPDHPAVIASAPPLDYQNGSYAVARYSLIVPVDAALLAAAPAFRALEHDLRARSFAPKIAWALLERRAPKLHITLVGGVREAELDECAAAVAPVLRRVGPLRYRLGGPFLGTKNVGRLYFTAYPERVDGDDVFGALQAAAGAARTQLYLLGHYNLNDELSGEEAADLADFLARWEGATLAELSCPALALIATHDDLALDSRVITRIPQLAPG
jgi:hypothetical protein